MIYSTQNYFSYVKRNAKLSEKNNYKIVIPDYKSGKWQRLNSTTTSSYTAQSAVVKNCGKPKACPLYRTTFKSPDTFEKVQVNPATSGSTKYTDNTFLWVDIENDGKDIEYMYGANAVLGKTEVYDFKTSIKKGDEVTISVYLINKVSTTATFLLPEITLFGDKYVAIKPTLSDQGNSLTKMTITLTPSMGEIDLYSMFLSKPHTSPYSAINYDSSEIAFASIPMIANGTHIIGIDIYDYSFLHAWKIKGSTTAYSYSMSILPIKTFTISMYMMKVKTTSWYDAMEKWHLRFSSVYSQQIVGAGRWAAFPELKKCFGTATTDRDVYGVNLQWGTSDSQVKSYIPSYFYQEPHKIHIELAKTTSNLETDLTNCKNNKTHPDRVKCGYILDYAPRDPNGKRKNITSENKSYNVGILGLVTVRGEQLKTIINNIKTELDKKIKNKVPFAGLAWDSYSTKAVDYISDGHKGFADSVLPYQVICENGYKCIPLMAFSFSLYNTFIRNTTLKNRYWPKGVITNAVYQPMQVVRFSASSGYETEISKDGKMNLGKWTQNVLWAQRYASGSIPLSHIDNVDRSVGYNVKEEFFAYMLTLGSAASYFSHNADENSFYTQCNEMNQQKAFFNKWKDITKKVLNNTVFYANQKGKVTMTFPAASQTPAITTDTTLEISTKTLFCKKGDSKGTCYLNVFLGYNDKHSYGSKFLRTAVVTIKGNNAKCIFNTSRITCTKNADSSFTVQMKGTLTGHTYQLAVIQFEDPTDIPNDATNDYLNEEMEEESNSNIETKGKEGKKWAIIGIVSGILGVALIAIIIGVVIIRKKTPKNSEFSESLNNLISNEKSQSERLNDLE